MCTNPQLIRNPNRGYGKMKYSDTQSQYIKVPCGHCDECVKLRQLYFVQRVQMEAMENHLFMCTLTYNEEMIPRLGLSNGHEVKFVDTKDFTNMLKRIRIHNLFGRKFRFVAVTEKGGERGRPHIHCLFFIPKQPTDTNGDILNLEHTMFNVVLEQWKRNVNHSRSRYAEYKPLCTYIRKFVRGKLRTTYDLHWVNPNLSDGQEADVAFYVSKYMIKQGKMDKRLQQALRLNLPDDEYKDVWRLVKPKWFASPSFGLNAEFIKLNKYRPSPKVLLQIKKGIKFSKDEFDRPKFVNPINGKTFPLARYYINRGDCFTTDDREYFWSKSIKEGKQRTDNLQIDEKDRNTVLNHIENARLKTDRLEFDYDDFDELF